jgi:ADP-ribose pyrophosphatase YjhB (NUDIX family)
MNYKEQVANYIPKCEQERIDQQLMLAFINRNPDVLFRTNLAAHFTVSSFVVNQAFTHVLFAYHNIYQSWAWLGGHNDGDSDLLKVALKEATEETGVKHFTPYQEDIFILDVVYVKNHIKHNQYVPDHLHLNVTFLLIASEEEELVIKHDENSGVKWFLIEEVPLHVSEERMIAIYQKAFNEIEKIRKTLNRSK